MRAGGWAQKDYGRAQKDLLKEQSSSMRAWHQHMRERERERQRQSASYSMCCPTSLGRDWL